MSFIDELIKSKGTGALGITYEKPKAHENIDNLILNNELSPEIQEVIQTAIMGSIGGGGKGLKNIIDIIFFKNIHNTIFENLL